MDKLEFHKMAKALMVEYLPTHKDWKIVYNMRKRGLGICNYNKKELGFSEYFVAVATKEDARNTITHEIAHANLQGGIGHSDMWKRRHIMFGGNGQRCSTVSNDMAHNVVTKPRYQLRCDNCGKKIPVYRKTKSSLRKACGDCCVKYNGGRYTDEYKLTLLQVRI